MLKNKPKRVNISLIPSVRQKFEEVARTYNMSLTEFLRRAAFAAEKDPTILSREVVEKSEEDYKASLGPSRWTRHHE